MTVPKSRRRRPSGSLLARHGFAALAIAVVALAIGMFQGTQKRAEALPGQVLLLDFNGGTAGSGVPGLDAAYVAAGKTVVTATPAQWALMTAADFDAFDAIAMGDPFCQTGVTGAIAAAIANAATWGSVVDGNVIIDGTDPQLHSGAGGQAFMNGAAAFSVADAGKTGAYVSLSCYYAFAGVLTPVTWLGQAFGGTWTVRGQFTFPITCPADSHLVATHPALAGITDATMSNWGCSTHEAFDTLPAPQFGFETLVISEDMPCAVPANCTWPDGSVGLPYVVARGATVISDIDLSPADDTNPVGTMHTLTATITTGTPPVPPPVGTMVTFEVVAGPHLGVLGTVPTNAAGVASISYMGTLVGDDVIEARATVNNRLQRSNRVMKHWVEGDQVGRVDCSDEITFVPRPQTFMTLKPGPAPYVGTFNFQARMTNTGDMQLTDIVAKITVLTNGNKLLSADNGAGVVGDVYTLPLGTGSYADAHLTPGEFADFPFRIGLMINKKFDFFVDIECMKHPHIP